MTETSAATQPDWSAWQRSWDRQQELYLPDREQRFAVMLDVVEACVGLRPRVLDLACGTGSITDRLLTRFSEATSTGVDLDPALLTIARGHFADDPRVQFVTADLRDPDWTRRLPYDRYDAVLTATALHWFEDDALRTLYRQVAGLLREGGVLLNVDHMPDETTPRLTATLRAHHEAQQRRQRAAGGQDWREWWRAASTAPELAEPTARRFSLLGNPLTGDHHRGGLPDAAWHQAALRDAGFAETRVVWASPYQDAMVLALA